jgi:hypothetical protein
MGVLSPGSVHAGPSAQPPNDVSENRRMCLHSYQNILTPSFFWHPKIVDSQHFLTHKIIWPRTFLTLNPFWPPKFVNPNTFDPIQFCPTFFFDPRIILDQSSCLKNCLGWPGGSAKYYFTPNLFFCGLRPHAKFQNPRTTPSGRKPKRRKEKKTPFPMDT